MNWRTRANRKVADPPTRQRADPDRATVDVLVVLIGLAVALLCLVAIVLDRFWPIALILLGLGVMH